jgi:hypothetical protein
MPKVKSITKLPANIRVELEHRLIKSGFSTFQVHSDWLESIGYGISKSAIHRYSAIHKGRMETQSSGATMSDYETASLKLQCLAICADKEDRFDKAFELFEWATDAKYKYATL